MTTILYLHQYFATPKSSYGTRSFEMSKRLVKDGYKIEMITTSAFMDDVYQFSPGWNKMSIDGINLHVLKLPYSNKDSFLNRIFKFLYFSIMATFKSLTIKADLVFATSTPLTIIIPALFFKFFKRKPLVFEVRDLWPELPIAVGAIKNPILVFFAKSLEVLAYKSAAKIITLSEGMSKGVLKKGIPCQKIVTITNGCDNDLFKIAPSIGETYRQEHLPFSLNKKLIVYTGTLGVINNVSYLVYLAKASLLNGNNSCFYVVGGGAEKNKVCALAKELEVLNVNFFIQDPISKLEVINVLSAADMSLSLFGNIPEMWANSANKLFDSMSAGKPIGINYKGWQYDLLKKRKFGVYLDPINYKLAAQQLDVFINNQELYETAKINARILSENEFSRDHLYSKFVGTLSQVK